MISPIKLEKNIKQARSAAIAPPTRIKAGILEYARANSFRRFPFYVLRYAVSISVVVLLGASGTVFASQQALPGQALYGLKRASETAYVSVQPNSQAKAEASEMLIGRRISEASQVVDSGAHDDDFLDIDMQLAGEAADASDAWIEAQTQAFSINIEGE